MLTALLLVFATGAGVTAQQAATGQVRGRVADASGAPLSDVQVYLEDGAGGATLGSLSRTGGVYVILNVPAGTYTLKAERLGLSSFTKQITVSAGSSLTEDIVLENQALNLDAIVVTGTAGAAKRREVGNQVTQINTVDLPDRPTSVFDMLTGMAPGVEITPNGGGETGNGSQIRIRGVNSINTNTSPVIFIDGIRMMSTNLGSVGGASNNASPLDQINPNDIERIEVISGPAASTLYGTEAAAGVIQVFTKRGQSRAPTWTAEVQQGTAWNTRFGASEEVCNTLSDQNLLKPDGSESPNSSPRAMCSYLNLSPWICIGPFNCGEFMHTPWTQNYSLSVRGGNQGLQYFVSGGKDGEQGTTPGDELRRYNVRGNFTLNPLQDLLFQWNTAYGNTWQDNSATNNNASGLTLNAIRLDKNYFSSGDRYVINTVLDRTNAQTIERFTTGGTFTYTPTTNLTQRLTIGYDYTTQEGRSIDPFGFIPQPDGRINVREYQRRFLTFDYVGTWTMNIGERLSSSFSWGGQAIGDASATVSATGTGFPGAAEPTISSASTTIATESREKVWNSGFFLQDVLAMSDRYFLTLGMRVDGNSTFGKNFNLQFYPKASASWVLSDENFWGDSWGEMKLRAAYGLAGRAPDALSSIRTWDNEGLGGLPAFVPDNLGNPDLGPEVTTEIELGFDASWFDARVRPAFTYYHQTTRDAIQNQASIPSLGFTSSIEYNVGKVQNFGKELRLDVTALRTRDWGLDVGAALAKNGNKVLEWAGEDPLNSDRIGRPIDYNRWTMYHNPESMGSARRSEGTYQAQSCDITFDDPVTGEEDAIVVPRPAIDPTIMACSFPSENIYGYPLDRPNVTGGITSTLRMPYGVSLSARGNFTGGPGWWRSTNAWGSAVGRNVRSPVCIPYYQNSINTALRTDTPAIWVQRCEAAVNTGGSAYWHKYNEFRLQTVSAQVPIDFLFSDRVQSAGLTLVVDNPWVWNQHLWGSMGLGLSERVPAPTAVRASIRVVF